jgi:hypothetical protein
VTEQEERLALSQAVQNVEQLDTVGAHDLHD